MPKKVWYEDDFSGDHKVLICGMGSSNVVPGKFEWANLWTGKYNDLKFKKMRLGDHNISWYHTHFPGIKGYGPFALAKFMKRKIKKANVEKVMLMGVSMGGYGAIMLGCILGVDQVVAFSPQTWLTEFRYKKAKLHKKFEGLDIDEKITDLKNVLDKYDQGKTMYHIYFGNKHGGDVKQANNISHFKNVILHPVNSKIHTVARELVKDGTVGEVMKAFTESV